MNHTRRPTAYFIGIKGVGMTALAIYLAQKGYDVSGSDVSDYFSTDDILSSHHIPVYIGFSEKNISRRYDVVVVTGAHGGKDNVEARMAHSRGMRVYSHGEFLGMCMEETDGISVAGCHGKTTTASVCAWILSRCDFHPSYVIGAAYIKGLGSAGRYGTGRWFIAEADEYVTCPQTDFTPRFLWQHPTIAIVTNIEYDHPDVYPSLDAVKQAYRSFLRGILPGGHLILCVDDPGVRSLLSSLEYPFVTYGFSEDADFRIGGVSFDQGVSRFQVFHARDSIGDFCLHIPGEHNMCNALAAGIAAHSAGVSWERIRDVLSSFSGAARRFERKGAWKSLIFFDDYAHHPTEIAATIRAAKHWYPDRSLVVVFQPHTFSRTKALFEEFSRSFSLADTVFISDIFSSAREQSDGSVNSRQLVSAIQTYGKDVRYLSDPEHFFTFLRERCDSNDLVLTLGAGDISTICDAFLRSVNGYYG